MLRRRSGSKCRKRIRILNHKVDEDLHMEVRLTEAVGLLLLSLLNEEELGYQVNLRFKMAEA